VTPLERGVRDFIIEWNRQRWQREVDRPIEASSFGGVLDAVRQRVAEAAHADDEEIKAALHSVGYTVQAVSERTYRLL
jgi:hypothetical protein